jgi:hypothetical protein
LRQLRDPTLVAPSPSGPPRSQPSARGPLILRDRTIEELEITDQAFSAVTWDGVDLVQSRFLRTTKRPDWS